MSSNRRTSGPICMLVPELSSSAAESTAVCWLGIEIHPLPPSAPASHEIVTIPPARRVWVTRVPFWTTSTDVARTMMSRSGWPIRDQVA